VCDESRQHGSNGGIGETYRKATRPDPTHWNGDPDKPCLRCQPTEPETTAKTWKYGPMQYRAFVLQKGTWINLSYSMSTLGSRKERMGQQETRHLQHFVGVLHVEHGKLLQGWQGRWEGRKGANAFLKGPMPSSATQMKEKRRKGRRSPKTGKPSARWARGVKEAPTGEGP